MDAAQAALIEQLVGVLAGDRRVRSIWLTGSLGKGEGDVWSDVDLAAVTAADDRAACLSDHLTGRPGAPQTVLARAIYGRILTAVTPEWRRFDIAFVTPEEFARMDRAAMKPLWGDAAPAPPPRGLAGDGGTAARLAALVEEFLRVLGLSPVGFGRQEWLVVQQGEALLRGMLTDLMLEEAGAPQRGAKRLNPFLTPEQRALLEGLVPPPPEREALLRANLAVAHVFLPRARALAAQVGAAWPEALEAATRRHLEAELGVGI